MAQRFSGKVVVITGASSGIGAAAASQFASEGATVALVARTEGALEKVAADIRGRGGAARAFPADVSDAQACAEVLRQVDASFGGIDVLVNNAGYGYRAAVEEGDDADIAALFATNFFGPVALIKAVLPGMRARRSGAIVNISSIGARICPPGSGYYAATKAALEGLSGSLRKELAPLGISVVAVEPGGFRTDFAGRSLQQSATVIDDYAETAGKRRKEHDTAHGTQPGDPVRAAQAILTAVEADQPPALLMLGTDALGAIRAVIDAQLAELAAWEKTSLSTDFPTPA
jgi:NAD(P)-dependent dehydrogenase (short-subunit alcohol dehydrogenase family)